MQRTIISKQVLIAKQTRAETGQMKPVAASNTTAGDDYKTRLLKYIPAESVAVYLTLDGVVRSLPQTTQAIWLWAIMLIGLVGTPLYLYRISRVTNPLQIAVSTVAFLVWVFALGGPFVMLPGYAPVYGSLALVIFTFFAPIVDPSGIIVNTKAADVPVVKAP